MKRVRIFNPLHFLGNKILVPDIEGLKILKLSQHLQFILQIEVMKTEVIARLTAYTMPMLTVYAVYRAENLPSRARLGAAVDRPP